MATEKKHAKFGASKSERYLNCPGSVALSELCPEQESSSPYAEEGTRAHECLEYFLRDPITIHSAHKSRDARSKFGAEVFRIARESALMVLRRHAEAGEHAELLVEEKISLEHIAPDTFGTVDWAIVEPFGTLTVGDFKFGAGIPVEVEYNTQAIFYALGIAHRYDYNFKEVILVIDQPRAEHESGKTVREWKLSMGELMAWIPKFKNGIEACSDPLAPLRYGKSWCKFCPAKAICPELSEKATREAQTVFGDVVIDSMKDETSPLALGIIDVEPGYLSETLEMCERVELWVSAVRELATRTLDRGEQIPGWKLVQKHSRRKWVDETKAFKQAHRDHGKKAFRVELLSPAQLEKVVGAEWVAERVTSESSGTTLVRESDKRPAATSAALAFENAPITGVKNGQRGKEIVSASAQRAPKTKVGKRRDYTRDAAKGKTKRR